MQRFLGMCNFISAFIPNLSDLNAPLREISHPQAEFEWSHRQNEAFNKIKNLMSNAPVVRYYDPKLPVTLQVDSSDYGMGAALLQQGQPVAFASSTFTSAEKNNLAQIEKECLAIVHAMSRWDQWLYGHPNILVETDHKPLETIFKHAILKAPKRLQKMLLKLQRYSFTVTYRKGSTMYLADTLSRAPTPRNNSLDCKFDIFANEVVNTQMKPDRLIDSTLELIKKATDSDPVLTSLKPLIKNGWPKKKSALAATLKPFFHYREDLVTSDNVIYKGNKVLIPTVMRQRMLEKIHSAHMGIEKSINNASDTLFWPSMNSDIKRTCENCQTCAKYANTHQKEPLLNHSIPVLPWEFVSQDIFKHDSKHYLVTVDHYSDFYEIDFLPDTLANTVINATKQQFARHGIPLQCLTDNGPQFISEQYKTFSKDWSFKHILSSPYYSQSNGRAEAAVKSAKNILRKCEDAQLGLLLLRNTRTKGHTSSPCQRLMSRRTRSFLTLTRAQLIPDIISPSTVQEEMQKQNEQSKFYYDKTAGPSLNPLSVGDYVFAKPPPNQRGQSWKYGKITDTPTPRSYTIDSNGSSIRRNRTQIHPATPPPTLYLPGNQDQADIEVVQEHGSGDSTGNPSVENIVGVQRTIGPQTETVQAETLPDFHKETTGTTPYKTRSGRSVVPNPKYK